MSRRKKVLKISMSDAANGSCKSMTEKSLFYLIMGVMKVLGIFDKGSLDGVSGVKTSV